MDKRDQNQEINPLPEKEFPINNLLSRLFLTGKKDRNLLLKLAGIIVIGILLMTFSNTWGSSKSNDPGTITADTVNSGDYYVNEKALEERLAVILGQISGAGEVKVAVSFATGKEVQYAYNTDSSTRESQEKNDIEENMGSDRESSQSLTLATDNDNPVIVKEYMPEIMGVLVVATGARDAGVKQKIFEAVEGLLALPAHRIVISY